WPGLRRHRRRSNRRRRRPGDPACSRDARPHFARLNRRRPMTRNRPLATIAFIVLSLALTWLLALPLWLDGGLANPLAGTIISAMMFTPALAVVIVLLLFRPVPKGERLRFLGMWPLRPAKRVVWMMVLGLFGPTVVIAASVAIAALCGWVQLDLVAFSGFAQQLEASTPAGIPVPPA